MRQQSPVTVYVIVPDNARETEREIPEIRELVALGFKPGERIEMLSPADHTRIVLRGWERIARPLAH